MEIEYVIKCKHCKEYTVLYIWDGGRRETRFYPEPHLDERKITRPNVNLKRKPNKDDPEKYDVTFECPVCGRPMGTYRGIPLDWKCLDTPGSLSLIPIKDLKPFMRRKPRGHKYSIYDFLINNKDHEEREEMMNKSALTTISIIGNR